MELMRWSGLRISDALTVAKNRIIGNRFALRTVKNDTKVTVIYAFLFQGEEVGVDLRSGDDYWCVGGPPDLFRKSELAVDVEMPGRAGRSGTGLTPADGDGVVATRDDRLAHVGDHAEIAIFQLEMNLLARARIEVNALEATQRKEGRAFHGWELEVELHDFIARRFACVGHRDVGGDRIARINRWLREAQVAVTEFRVAQSIAKGIERRAFKVPVGAALHRVILEIG